MAMVRLLEINDYDTSKIPDYVFTTSPWDLHKALLSKKRL